MTGTFLAEPATTPQVQHLYDTDLADEGYVMNVTRLWAYEPETQQHLFDLIGEAFARSALGSRQRAILVAATVSAFGDAYCSFAWGGRLARASDPDLAAGVLNGTDRGLTDQESALASWARMVATDPNGTTAQDVDRLREIGLDDAQIFAITAFVALRIAFATVNDALGARPDGRLVAALPPAIVHAVTFGRPPT